MLQPKRQKYRNQFRKGDGTVGERGTKVVFGDYGLKVLSSGRISDKQLEAARRTIAFFTRKGGKIWTRIFPDKPITKKALGTRMGSGKGDIFGYVFPITAGRVIMEVGGIPEAEAKEAIRQAGFKMPLKTICVSKR